MDEETRSPEISGTGTLIIKKADLEKLLTQRVIQTGFFYTFNRARVTPEGDLEARYAFSNQATPSEPV